ncbi:MAG: CDP-archaeol synthase [Methylobacteriaceae bacterium]|nr:CDP-archaeol synthase [Methylobacteriaceae bacterium]MBV9247401.1 CDP-archaeol synthase [Methylobacteriaceae bacterium]
MTGLPRDEVDNRCGSDVAALPRRAASQRALADVLPRLASSVVLIAVALAATFYGGYWFGLAALVAAAGILFEWQNLVGGPNVGLRIGSGSIGLALAVYFSLDGNPHWALAALVAASLLLSLAAGPDRRLWAAAGPLYAGIMLVSIAVLRSSEPFGFEAIIWLFAVVWGNDTMAYFAGRLVGGPKLWPRLSPSKTWAGTVVGVLCGALAGLAAGLALGPASGSPWHYLALGLACALAALAGDLLESSIKRRFAVKDSSGLIPGHGGVMDRLDGFIAASVLAAAVGVSRFGVASAAAGLFSW